MNIHEYQAKAILKSYGAPVANGAVITDASQIDQAIASMPGPVWVVKSQIHAGGRGKGKFKELPAEAKGGVRVSFSPTKPRPMRVKCMAKPLLPRKQGKAARP